MKSMAYLEAYEGRYPEEPDPNESRIFQLIWRTMISMRKRLIDVDPEDVRRALDLIKDEGHKIIEIHDLNHVIQPAFVKDAGDWTIFRDSFAEALHATYPQLREIEDEKEAVHQGP